MTFVVLTGCGEAAFQDRLPRVFVADPWNNMKYDSYQQVSLSPRVAAMEEAVDCRALQLTVQYPKLSDERRRISLLCSSQSYCHNKKMGGEEAHYFRLEVAFNDFLTKLTYSEKRIEKQSKCPPNCNDHYH